MAKSARVMLHEEPQRSADLSLIDKRSPAYKQMTTSRFRFSQLHGSRPIDTEGSRMCQRDQERERQVNDLVDGCKTV
jgi:hypothetical protein